VFLFARTSFGLTWFGSWKPFCVRIASTSKIGDSLTAQKGKISLHSCFHRPPGIIAILLAVPLTVENGCSQLRGIELSGDGWQTFVTNRRYDGITIRAIIS